jgi:hypothetical protein
VIEPTEEELTELRKVPKWKACERLKREGRLDDFRRRQGIVKKEKHVTVTEAFYLALFEFPPLE